MMHQTTGIVLRTVKYTDSRFITNIYTRDLGLQSYMVNGGRGGKGKSRTGSLLFQPLSVVDLVVTHNNKNSLHRIMEIGTSFLQNSSASNPVKRTIMLFLNEVLYKSIREEGSSDPALFEFIRNSLEILEHSDMVSVNFHLLFLAKLSRFMGFYPRGSHSAQTPWFDLREGSFMPSEPLHPEYLSGSYSKLFSALLEHDFETVSSLDINNEDRRKLLNILVEYYRLHINSMAEIKSHHVLEEIVS